MTSVAELKAVFGAKRERRTCDGLIIVEVPRDRSWTVRRATPNIDGTEGGVFRGDEPISFTVYSREQGKPIFSVDGAPNAWYDPRFTAWEIRFDPADTAKLKRRRLYDLTVWVRMPDDVAQLFVGKIKVV